MEEIKYPLFVFENTHNDNKLGDYIEHIYNSIEELNLELEAWIVDEDDMRAYDAEGRLLNLSTEWRKIKEKGLFGSRIVDREFIKVSMNDNRPVYADLLKQLLESEVQTRLIDMQKQLNILKVKTGLFGKKKVIDDNSTTIHLADNSYINSDLVKQAILAFIKKFLTPDLSKIRDDLALPELVQLIKILKYQY